MGAVGGIVLSLSGMQLLGGGSPEPISVAPAPYPDLTQSAPAATDAAPTAATFLDSALPATDGTQ